MPLVPVTSPFHSDRSIVSWPRRRSTSSCVPPKAACARHETSACRPDVSLVKLYDVNSAPNNSGVVTTQTAHRDAMLAEPNAAGEKTTADFVECWSPANPLTSRAPASILGACAGRERSEG